MCCRLLSRTEPEVASHAFRLTPSELRPCPCLYLPAAVLRGPLLSFIGTARQHPSTVNKGTRSFSLSLWPFPSISSGDPPLLDRHASHRIRSTPRAPFIRSLYASAAQSWTGRPHSGASPQVLQEPTGSLPIRQSYRSTAHRGKPAQACFFFSRGGWLFATTATEWTPRPLHHASS